MSDQLFIVLRVCLLALVYLVFLRVLRAVWVELRAEAAVPSGMQPVAKRAFRPERARTVSPGARAAGSTVLSTGNALSTGMARLIVVAPSALVGHAFALDGETTIGRGAGCGVAIDDAHVSKLHARVSPHDGGWVLEDLGSTNGTALDGQLIAAPTQMRQGSRITIGEVVLELA